MAKSITHTISILREYIKQTSDDTKYSDSFLYDVLLNVRNDFLPKSLKEGKPIANDLWKLMCIPLCQSTLSLCNIPTKTKVLKSKEKIPNYITSKDYRYIQVLTIDGSLQIPYKTLSQGKHYKYRKGDNKMWFTIVDNYLYIINHPTNTLKAIAINIILADPRDAIFMSYCNENGETSEDNYYNPHKDTFSITLDLENAVIMTALKQLGITLQLPDDTSNNTDSTVNKY